MRGFHHLASRYRARLLRKADLKGEVLSAKYETRSPQPQNAVDLFSEWTGSFPAEHGLDAGDMALHADPRLHWALDQYGPLEGARVLELGPLEGAHSMMLEQRGAAQVVAIEANKQAYLKCLVAKEINGLTRCRFLLGDFERYLHETDDTFDIILASGVLYHMAHPIEVLDAIARRCQTLILWTHYFDDTEMGAQDVRRGAFSGDPVVVTHKGRDYTLHPRRYHGAWHADRYCGGPEDGHYWMERAGIEALCRDHGFVDIRTSFEDADHVNGPACLFYMSKDAPAA